MGVGKGGSSRGLGGGVGGYVLEVGGKGGRGGEGEEGERKRI